MCIRLLRTESDRVSVFSVWCATHETSVNSKAVMCTAGSENLAYC